MYFLFLEEFCSKMCHSPCCTIQRIAHQLTYFIYPTPGRSIAEQYREDPSEWDKRGLRDVTGDDSLRSAGKTCFYPIYIKDGQVIGFGDVCADDYHPAVNVKRDDGVIEVYPIDPQGIERKWRFGRDTIEGIREQLSANYIANRDVWDIQRLKKHFNYKTVWQAPKYSANNYGTQVLNRMFTAPPFTYPKSIYTVKDCIEVAMNGKASGVIMDFFAGAGTTGQGKVKTVSVDSFEQNNLVLVDEGHRGLSGDVWYDYRTRLSAEGFAFEYSATFRH